MLGDDRRLPLLSTDATDVLKRTSRPTHPPASLTREQWVTLAVTTVLWMFDGYETYALLLTVGPALRELLSAGQLLQFSQIASYLIALTLFGWAIGGIVGGFVGDRLGRRVTMVGAVLIYSVFTGTSALAHSWETLALTRFLTGIGLGAEWGVGTALLQEVWPESLRTKGVGFLQAAFSGGFVLASVFWIVIGGTFGLSWRWMYVFGVLPGLFVGVTGWLIPESNRWNRSGRREPFRLSALWGYRRSLIVALVVSISITVGFWATSSWVPTVAAGLVHNAPRSSVFYAGWAGMLFAVGEMFGCVVFGLASESLGRRPTLALYLAGSILVTPVVYLLVGDPRIFVLLQLANGFLTGGLYGWYAVHPPELFPTAIRASAISLIFNLARFVAMFGPIFSANLVALLGGYGLAATILSSFFAVGFVALWFLPETKGKYLPV